MSDISKLRLEINKLIRMLKDRRMSDFMKWDEVIIEAQRVQLRIDELEEEDDNR